MKIRNLDPIQLALLVVIVLSLLFILNLAVAISSPIIVISLIGYGALSLFTALTEDKIHKKVYRWPQSV